MPEGKVSTRTGLDHVLERIYTCGLPCNRPIGNLAGMCAPIFQDQTFKNPRLKVGLTPSPFFGDLRAPIVFVGINPQHNPIDLAYDDLPRSDREEEYRRFRKYALGKHGSLMENEYRSTTSRARNSYLGRISRELNSLHGTRLDLTIRRGAVFTTNVVQCPTETIWGDLDIPKETKSKIAQTCSDSHLAGIFDELRNPKIAFFVGNDAFDWLKRRKEFDKSQVKDDKRCDMDWSSGSGANAGKCCVVRYRGVKFYAIINPRPSVIRDGGLTSELIRGRFLLSEDYSYIR